MIQKIVWVLCITVFAASNSLVTETVKAYASSASSGEKVIHLATLEWPPYVGQTLKGKGLSSAIIVQVFKQMGYEVELSFRPWARVLSEVKLGHFDAGYPSYYSKERESLFGLSKPFLHSPLRFLAHKEKPIVYNSLKDLQHYRIGVVHGYLNTPALDGAEYLRKIKSNSDKENLEKLIQGKLDLIVIDEYVAIHIFNQYFPNLLESYTFLQPPLQNKPLHLIFSRKKKGFEQILEKFNKTYEKMRTNGEIDRIHTQFGL